MHAENRSWLYHFKLIRKAHLTGLGTLDHISLAEAGDAAALALRFAILATARSGEVSGAG